MVAVGEVAVAAALSHEVLKSQRYKHSQSTEACAANAKCPLSMETPLPHSPNLTVNLTLLQSYCVNLASGVRWRFSGKYF